MLDAICISSLIGFNSDDDTLRAHWSSLLEAAPKPPETTQAAPQGRQAVQPVAWRYRYTNPIAPHGWRLSDKHASPTSEMDVEPLYPSSQPAGRDARETHHEP